MGGRVVIDDHLSRMQSCVEQLSRQTGHLILPALPSFLCETALVLEQNAAACENWSATPWPQRGLAVAGGAGYRRAASLHGIIQESDK
jgi:hypothetical protein